MRERVDPARGANRAVTQRLERAVARDRLHGGLLFTGPPGSGREATARWLAARLLCEEESAPCGVCSHCRKIVEELHPDVAMRRPTSRSRRIVIDDVRALQEEVAFRPFEARRRLFAVLEADRMTEQAANAFLKTLEEPPSAVVLVLTAPSAASLLPTVRSRCQPMTFPPLPTADLADDLASRHELEPASLRIGLSLLDGDPTAATEQEGEEVRRERDALVSLLEELSAGSSRTRGILSFVEDRHKAPRRNDEGARTEPDRLVRALTVLRVVARDVLRAASGAEGALVNADMEGRIRSLATSLGPGGAASLLGLVEEARQNLDRGANRRLTGEDLLLGVRELF